MVQLLRSTFSVPKMDCPSEERLIRMAVEALDEVQRLEFDVDERTVRVTHSGDAAPILERMGPLGLGARLDGTEVAPSGATTPEPDFAAERRVLRLVLAINATMFVGELVLGIVAQSTGLIADSLDMLADAMVYGMSLLAVGGEIAPQRRTARFSGWIQLALASGVIFEVGRRALAGAEPVESLMVGVAVVALLANLASVALLARHRSGGVHLRASWIFTTTDALANLGVIAAGVLVGITGSAVPDLVVGTLISILVFGGAIRILRIASEAQTAPTNPDIPDESA